MKNFAHQIILPNGCFKKEVSATKAPHKSTKIIRRSLIALCLFSALLGASFSAGYNKAQEEVTEEHGFVLPTYVDTDDADVSQEVTLPSK